MNWRRWRELMNILDRLGMVDLLRTNLRSDQLYLVDRLVWLIAVIERIRETEDEDCRWLLTDGD
jgi:hypothetical protein